MKTKFLLAGILAVLTTLPLMSGCAITDDMSYANADQYTVGGGSVSGMVTEMEIDWIDGNIEIVYGEVENVTFSETSNVELSTENTLHYWLENTTLHIKFAQSKKLVALNRYPDKDLKVMLPASMALQELDVQAVNTDIKLDHLAAEKVEIETVDGAVNAYLVGTTREISVERWRGTSC